MTTQTLREVFCDAVSCRLRDKGTPIAYTDGRECRAYCGSCRRWTHWSIYRRGKS